MSDNMDLKAGIPKQEEKGIAMEILEELKAQNERLMGINKKQIGIISWLIVLVAAIVAGFLIYLWQYDFSGSIEQSGVYTLVDSDGNIISSDIEPEQIEEILKIINGKNESNEKQD